MKEEFLDYVEDIIKAMDDALSFVKGIDILLKIERPCMRLPEL